MSPERLNLVQKEAISASGPIMLCVGSPNTFDKESKKHLKALRAQNVDYFGESSHQREIGISTAGENTYVISPSDSENKMSRGFENCTGLILVGRGKDGTNVSLLTHQDPHAILGQHREAFLRDLDLKLNAFMTQVEHESIDAVIIGGNYHVDAWSEGATRQGKTVADDYEESVKLVSEQLARNYGLDARVPIGPIRTRGRVDVWFDTRNRRLYVIRPSQPEPNIDTSFKSSEIAAAMDYWEQAA